MLNEIVESQKGGIIRPMNKAQVYQAIKKAKIHGNYMNKDLNVKNYIPSGQFDKFEPYFQQISRRTNNLTNNSLEEILPKLPRSV